jgi:DNA polymerase III beta subunit, central domain
MTAHKKSFIVDIRCLKAASEFSSNDETRYYLKGVCIDKGLLVATDGHRLTAIKPCDAPESNKDFYKIIIPNEAIKRILAVKGMHKTFPLLVEIKGSDTDENMFTATIFHALDDLLIVGKIDFAPIDGTFPDWRKIMPKADDLKAREDGATTFSTNILASLKALCPKNESEFVALYLNKNARSPSVVRADNEVFEAVSVIMPVHLPTHNNLAEPLPSWLEM